MGNTNTRIAWFDLNDDPELIDDVVKKGIDINKIDVCFKSEPSFVKPIGEVCVDEKYEKCFRYLLENGYDIYEHNAEKILDLTFGTLSFETIQFVINNDYQPNYSQVIRMLRRDNVTDVELKRYVINNYYGIVSDVDVVDYLVEDEDTCESDETIYLMCLLISSGYKLSKDDLELFYDYSLTKLLKTLNDSDNIVNSAIKYVFEHTCNKCNTYTKFNECSNCSDDKCYSELLAKLD